MTASKRPDAGKRPFPGAFVVLALVVLLGAGFLVARAYFSQPLAGTLQEQAGADIGGPFTLVDQDGKTVSDTDFRGKYMLIYFGYTFCPDVCPTSLARNADALKLLGDKAAKVQPILITVDPERDTPETLKPYVAAFGPNLIGLTGTVEQITALARAYRTFFGKAPAAAGSDAYLMDHSSFTYLMAPDGHFLRVFSQSTKPKQMAEELAQAIN
jgi:Uncharacterized protein SCO1/SenC/PrrC, involved in biogenesis of respiratory and photosynthetic systems